MKYKNTLPLKIENELTKIKFDNLNNIRIISSDSSGVGKFTQIKKNINIDNYKYFPIGGVFTRKSIMKRLNDLELTDNSEIHLDLNDTDNVDLMMEFLFSILIIKIYKVNEDIFYINKNIKFYIEIPNGFISFKLKFPISDLIPEIFNEKSLNNNNIDIPNVTPKDLSKHTSVRKPSKIVIEGEAQALIFEIVKKTNKSPSYYEITSLIDVLACQLKKFNQSYFLNPIYLNNALHFRTFLFESFIKQATYFSEGTFTNLINEQIITHNSFLFDYYDENEEIKKGLDELIENLDKEGHSTISFDKIPHTLIVFNEGNGQGFSIIINKDKNDIEYKKYYKLKNCQVINEKEKKDLPNYTKYGQLDFLRELKEILNLNTAFPVEKKDTNNEYKLSLEEIANNYAFTPDNFVKMMVILMRIRANIPIILMGETGCGKTSLIKKLFELKNYGSKQYLKVLNIHAGTNDEEILCFIKKVNKEAKKLYEEQIEKREFARKNQIFYEEKCF